MEKQFKYYYSLVTGHVEKILADEIKLLEVYQIPLKVHPKENCQKCFDRRYVSFDRINKAYLPCACVKKAIDTENYKNGEISFYNPK